MLNRSPDGLRSDPEPDEHLAPPRVTRRRLLTRVTAAGIPALAASLPGVARAAEPSRTAAATEDRVRALIPEFEAYIAAGMKGFDVPGLAMGIVAGDKLVYS